MESATLATIRKVKAKLSSQVTVLIAGKGGQKRTENGRPILFSNVHSKFYLSLKSDSLDSCQYTRSVSDPDFSSLMRLSLKEEEENMEATRIASLRSTLVASNDNIHQQDRPARAVPFSESQRSSADSTLSVGRQLNVGSVVAEDARNSALTVSNQPVDRLPGNPAVLRAVSKPRPPVPPKKSSSARNNAMTIDISQPEIVLDSSDSPSPSLKSCSAASSNSKPSPKPPPRPAKKPSIVSVLEADSSINFSAPSTTVAANSSAGSCVSTSSTERLSEREPIVKSRASSTVSPTLHCAISPSSGTVSFSCPSQPSVEKIYLVLPDCHASDSDFALSVPIKQRQTHMIRAYPIVDISVPTSPIDTADGESDQGRQTQVLPPHPPWRLTNAISNLSSDGSVEDSEYLVTVDTFTGISNGSVPRERPPESKAPGSPIAKLANHKLQEYKVQKENGLSKLSKTLNVRGIIPEAMEKEVKRHSLPGYAQAAADSNGAVSCSSAVRATSDTRSQYARTSSDVTPAVAEEDEGWDSDEFDSGSDDEAENAMGQSSSSVLDLDPAARKIYNIVHEIVTTERAYVKRLYLLDKVFQERLLKEARENQIISEKVLREIFSNLSALYTFHSTILLPDLEKRIGVWHSDSRIGDIFKTLGHCLLLYTEFVRNFENSNSTITYWLKKSPKFASVIESLQRLPECENLTLQHHMIEPVQRVPRYKLLLQDYLKKLSAEAPDRREAEDSLSIIAKAAEHANSSMKENEKFKKLLDLQDRISEGLNGDSIVTASRMFIKEGELTKMAARSGQTMIRTLLLFNDLLLCCTKLHPTGKLRVRQICDLAGLVIDETDSDLSHPYAFRIKSRQRVLDLIAPSADDKGDWIESIRLAVRELDDKRGSMLRMRLEEDERNPQLPWATVGEAAPVWVKDEDVSMCMLCAAKFGLIYRKHHCRCCGRVTCDKCSIYRARLVYTGEIERICFPCQSKLCGESFEEKMVKRASIRARTSSAQSDMSGDLFWKPPGKGWSKEWFVLSDFVLYVSKRRQDVKAFMTVPVPGFEVDRPSMGDEQDFPHPYCVRLHKQNKKHLTYLLVSDSEQTLLKWEEHLRFAVRLEKRPDVTEN